MTRGSCFVYDGRTEEQMGLGNMLNWMNVSPDKIQDPSSTIHEIKQQPENGRIIRV